ncbi:MAG: hypothetical protein KatS3mg105_1748 [Gemmatales bacterium]|nr:MAG: hypothetical protein KatS3mg105_1748 [Gemmatales bacterium]
MKPTFWLVAVSVATWVGLAGANVSYEPGFEKRVQQLIRHLDDDRFFVREAAMAELSRLGSAAAPFLKQALKENPSVDLRWRIEKLLASCKLNEAIRQAEEAIAKHEALASLKFITAASRDDASKQARNLMPDIARAALMLRERINEFEQIEPLVNKEKSEELRARYYLVYARLLEQSIRHTEYGHVLAKVRVEALPPLGAEHVGWRLGTAQKLISRGAEGREARLAQKRREEILRKVASDFAKTEWGKKALEELNKDLGLTWKPSRDS